MFGGVCGCGRPSLKDEPLRPSQVDDFDQLFAKNCTGCHGVDGKLGPAPPLDDPMFLAIISIDESRRVISEGRTGTMMPAFSREHGGELTPLQIDILIEGMRSRWAKPVADASSLPAYAGTPIDHTEVADPTASEALFAKECGSCHGQHGEGGDAGPLKVPAFLELVSNQALRRVIITGRPDLNMPDFRQRAQMIPGSSPISSADIDKIVALLAKWREEGYPLVPQAHEQAMR